MTYTVKQLSDLAGVSVATLHYYDEIELLQPSYLGENGYRYYQKKELLRLQQILFFKELDFALDQIKEMLDNPDFDAIQAFQDQKRMLNVKRERIDGLINTLNQNIQTMKGGGEMNDQQLYGSLSNDQIEQYKQEARERWGEDKVRESEERMKNWTKEDYEKIQQDTATVLRIIVVHMDQGVEAGAVQEQIERYYGIINQYYDCNYEIFRGLGKMYVEDDRFTAFYDKYHPDLAQFMCDAMAHYCDVHE